MARNNISDYLQAYPFWLMDVGPTGTIEFPVFTPLLGFATISAPEITGDVYTFREGNRYFPRNVLKGGALGGFTITRAVSFTDSDFWSWMMDALTGHVAYQVGGPTSRRDLLLIHYFSRSPIPGIGLTISNSNAQKGPTFESLSFGPFEVTARIPARAYALAGCIPTRWKSGTDFDASSSAISIAELDFTCEGVELIDISGLLKNAVGAVTAAIGLL